MFLLPALFTQCSEVQTELETDKDVISMDFNGGEIVVDVFCNVSTLTTVYYEGEDSDWIFVLPRSLQGDGHLVFQIGRNMAYETTRTARAVIAGKGVEKTIAVTQTGRPKPVATDLDLNRYSICSDVEGGNYDINVSTEGEWNAVSNQPWCKVKDGTNTGIGKFTICIERSEDYRYRTAEVSVTAGSLAPRIVQIQHVGTRIGSLVWANANVAAPDTFGDNCEVRGSLYQWNSKIPFPSYSANNHGEPSKPVPGYVGGPNDAHSEVWTEENDPCPEGWRVPTNEELNTLFYAGGPNPLFWFDYHMEKGLSVAGAFVGLSPEQCKTDITRDDFHGAIFIPQAGMIDRDKCLQENWWSVSLWSGTTVGQTWDMFGIWLDGNQGIGKNCWYGSRCGLSVRCIKK